MELTAQQLADVLHGTVEGNPQETVTSFAKIEHGKKGQLCFFANPKYEQYVYTSEASVLLVNYDFKPTAPVTPTLVRVPDAYSALSELLKYVADLHKKYRRHRGRCRIAWSAKLGKKVPGMEIGDRVILHAGCIIGDDGFGNAPQPDGSWKKIEHLGNVIIEDDVEIGSNTTIDKAPMESTIIKKGARIDNLCQIAHNVVVGENTAIAAMTGIAGSAKIGKNCLCGGQVGVAGHINIADHTTVAAKSGVIGNIRKEGQTLFGIPSIDYNVFMRA